MPGVVRIQGLVRIAQNLRLRIGQGMTDSEKALARRNTERAIADVDRILASSGATPQHLAAPSRNAYQFLKQIPWDRIGAPSSSETPAARPSTIRWTGLSTLLDRLILRLATRPADAELQTIAQAIARQSAQIEGTIRRENFSPHQLTPATRDMRAWFAFLAQSDNLAQYLSAIDRASTHFRNAAVVPPEERLLLEFRPTRHIYRMMRYLDGRRVVMPTAMICFDEFHFADLALLITQRGRLAKRKVEENMHGEAYQDLVEELEGLGGVVEVTRGACHDLAQSFDRVNARYFAGAIARPKLSWSAGFTSRKFGHYSHLQDWVMLSSTMDQPHVPAFVVDFVMYHELLHKKHGIRWKNGRGHAHTPEFNAEERQFESYAQAEEWLKKLARG